MLFFQMLISLQYYCITCEGHLIGQSCRCSRPVLEKRRKITIARGELDMSLSKIGKQKFQRQIGVYFRKLIALVRL